MTDSIEKLYETIFDPIFLIRFGYYDISVKKNTNIELEDFDLEDIYGKSDSFFYKVFNMEHVADFFKENNDLNNLFNTKNPYKRNSTEPVYFNIPKNDNSRRQYKMPNLYSYIELMLFMCEHKGEFIEAFTHNEFSTSKFFNQLNFNFPITQEFKEQLLQGGIKRLSIDLSNFYPTLYTHSIPWAISGKDEAKKDRENGFANHLDKYITLCQYDETHGIPTGNLLSRIIAELYMCYVDERMKEANFRYARYVDDIVFPYSSGSRKDDFLQEFNGICRELNLIINDKKTTVDSFPHGNKSSKTDIFSFFNHLSSNNKTQTWVKEISSFIDFCVGEEALGNKGSVKSIYSVIINAIKNKKLPKKLVENIFLQTNEVTQFNVFEKLLDLSLKNSILTNRFIEFVNQLSKLGFPGENASHIVNKYFKKNQEAYRDGISYYIDVKYNQELYQILLYLVEFEVINFLKEEELIELINSNLDDYSLILATILYLKNQYEIEPLLSKVDVLFTKTHNTYSQNSVRMTEKFWFYRYFIYSLVYEEIIAKKELNKYYRKKGYKNVNRKGYASELNWGYIKNRPYENNIDKFYDQLLTNNVQLVHFGKDNSFSYLQ